MSRFDAHLLNERHHMAKRLAESGSHGAAKPPTRTVKKPTAFNLPEDLLEQARNTVFWVPGLTMAKLAEEGIRDAISKYQRKHNNGKPFPARQENLRAGRPVGR
jgi:hypothetical protein